MIFESIKTGTHNNYNKHSKCHYLLPSGGCEYKIQHEGAKKRDSGGVPKYRPEKKVFSNNDFFTGLKLQRLYSTLLSQGRTF